jgi:peptide/nickel transport system permease protein
VSPARATARAGSPAPPPSAWGGARGAAPGRPGVAGSPALRMVGRRLLAAIPVLIGVTFLTFAIMSALPNNTAQAILGLNASQSAVAALNHTLGLDRPFWAQYLSWLGNVLHGNFGTSIQGQSVNHELAIHVPTTLALLLYALVVSVALAIIVATLAARRPNGIADRVSLTVSMLGLSTAPYAFAFVLIIIFAVKLQWFPVLSGPITGPASFFKNLTLPAAAIGFGLFAIYTRLLRADLVEQMQREDYIVTAKAKGVAPWRVLIRHALRNSMFTLITVIGLNLGGLVGAAAIIETIFQVQGIGNDLLTGIMNRDAPLIEGITLLFAIVTVAGNLLADIAYAVLDPRIRYGSSTS